MSRWFLYFFYYSLAGCALEKVFARLVRAEKQVRKCFLVLPLCPVYGLAMTALLALGREGSFLLLTVRGALVCTAVEYGVHFFYEKALFVHFWDYRGIPGHIRGRVCPQFALAWGVLSAVAVRWFQPLVDVVTALTPRWVAFTLWMLLVLDGVFTWALLRRNKDTALLELTVLAQRWASSQSSTSL